MTPPDHNIFGQKPQQCGRNLSVEVFAVGKNLDFEIGERLIIQRGKFAVMEIDGVQTVTVPEKYIMAKIEL